MALQVVHDPEQFRSLCDELRTRGAVGFVPTMGALHQGHVQLMHFAAQHARSVVTSIFVNPTQFGPNEDLARYPRQLEADCAACEQAGVAVVFAPNAAAMYPEGEQTRVHVAKLSAGLCGAKRPGHFDGVCTIVAKLFALTGPCVAVFGRKDYQQWRVLQRMTWDLLLPVKLLGHPIVREADGLALSSRNRYLSAEQRTQALGLVQGLRAAAAAFAQGERSTEQLRSLCLQPLNQAGLTLDYVELVEPVNLSPVGNEVPQRVLLAVAAFAGSTRLIDNCVLGEEVSP